MARKLMTSGFTAFLLALVCNVAVPAASASPWQGEIDECAKRIRSTDYTGALNGLNGIVSGMVERLGGGEADNQLFATVLVYRALASAGLGNVNDSLWDWYVAQDISAAAEKIDLVPFGAPGEFLKFHPLTTAETVSGVIPPQVLTRVVPKFPAGASRFGVSGDLVVQVVVDRNGEPTLPRIVHPLPAPALSFVALEALRRWHFQPAKHDGAPVAAVFNLTVHYKL